MGVVLSIIGTAMVLSFTFALSAIVYDVTSEVGLSDRQAKAITVLYLWPTAIVGGYALVLALALIWGILL